MKIKRISVATISVFLSFAFLLSACTSCRKNNDNQNENIEAFTYSETEPYKDGIHIFNKTKRSEYIVKDGVSDYQIIIPNEADETVSTAAIELQALIEEATNVGLDVKYEDEKSSGKKYISLGDTVLSTTNNVSVKDTKINSNGYIIKTIGDNVYILAKESHGVLWGVYEFLIQTVGYNCVSYDSWIFEDKSGNISLYDFDIIDSPDFELRMSGNGVVDISEEYGHKYRWLGRSKDVFSQASYHNYFYYLPKSEYESSHPGWYSDDGTQLCLTAHGDEDEYRLMVDEVAKKVEEDLLAEPNKKVVTITQEDYNTWCGCATCKSLQAKYNGCDSAASIMFVNDVADLVNEWIDKNQPGREIYIAMFAYMKTLTPPVVKNADGTYSPIDQKVVCRDNVAAYYAPVFEPLAYGADQVENLNIQYSVEGWSAICKNIGYWWYHTNYCFYKIMYNTFGVTQRTYRYLLNNSNAVWIFDQGQTSSANSTGFISFKMYLQSQWQWNVNKEYSKLKEDFFSVYFKDAKEPMEQFFNEYSTVTYNIINSGKALGIYDDLLKEEYFSYRTLAQWLKYIDNAYEAIEKYKETDPILYNKLYDHINIESISIRYLINELYIGKYTNEEAQKFTQAYERDCEKYGITDSESAG